MVKQCGGRKKGNLAALRLPKDYRRAVCSDKAAKPMHVHCCSPPWQALRGVRTTLFSEVLYGHGHYAFIVYSRCKGKPFLHIFQIKMQNQALILRP